ncbi:YitT family protein, partial [Staphylococcus warneri]|uniref:YitT family protein n=1 Tax=Staphylococcus warneri TaxID=1292 RepID=UPI0021BDB38D
MAPIITKYSQLKTSQPFFILHPLLLLSFLILLPLTNLLYTILMFFILQKPIPFLVEAFNPKKPLTLI